VPVRRRAEMAWEEADKQGLELFREKASTARLISVAGDPVRAAYLKGADLDGVDCAVLPASGLAQSPDGRVRNAEEGAAAGYIDPQSAAEMRQTGLEQTMVDNETTARIQKQGADALRGQPQQPLPGVPGPAAARILRMMVARAPAGRSITLMQLIAAYESQPPPMPQGGPAPPGAPKPAVTATTQAQAEQVPPGAIQ